MLQTRMLQTRFAQQLTTNYPTQSTFLIAFSGGLDSTALLSLFANQAKICRELKLRAIHIHHGLSPNADYWAEHCQQICHQLHIPLIIERVQVCKEKGIEAGAREARYQAMARQLQTGEVLVTAHHQQDQTETFFLALKRGSGIKGLSAMQAKSAVFNLAVFRPLLEFTRQELQQYAEQSGLPWIEDESNEDNRYERNFLRNQVLPQLRERWKHIDQAVQRTAQHCFEQQQLLTELLQEDLQNCIQNDRTFALTAFPHFSSAKQKMLLRLWLEQWDIPMPSQKQLEQILSDVVLAQADKNPQFKLGQKYLRRYQQTLHLTEKFADLRTYRLPIQLGQQVELPDGLGQLSLSKQEEQEEQEEQGEQWIIEWQEKRSFLSPTTAPIEIRFHYSGKVRQKNGLNEDIKKCWQRHLVPTWQRQRIPLIFYGEVFQCAVGLFTNHP